MSYDKCIRIDLSTGEQTDCELSRAERAICNCYKPSQPLMDMLHDGERVRTMFAIYQVVRSVR
jgi:hypothetical protein